MFGTSHHAADADTDEEAAAALREAAAVRALKGFVRRHNWQALTLAFFSLVTSLVLWGGAYLASYWLCLITMTINRSLNNQALSEVNDSQIIASWFPWAFLGGAVLLLILSRIARRLYRADDLRDANLYLLWVAMELLLSIPNVTFSIWGNLAAMVRLRRADGVQAWRLLEWMHNEGDRLTASGLRLLVDDERQLERIVFVLQIVGLVELREKSEGWFLYLQNRDAYALMSRGGV